MSYLATRILHPIMTSIDQSTWVRDLKRNCRSLFNICNTVNASVAIESRPFMNDTVDTITFYHSKSKVTRYLKSSGSDIYPVASLTKPLVAVALVIATIKAEKQMENNPWAKFRIDLDTSFTQVYNEHSGSELTLLGDPSVLNILLHRKGLISCNHRFLAPDGTPMLVRKHALPDLICPLADNPSREGEVWIEYSNTNYLLISLLIEALWSRDLSSFMEETLFGPLGMKDTSIGLQGLAHTKRYAVTEAGKIDIVQGVDYRSDEAVAGAMGAYTTTRDWMKFTSFVLHTLYEEKVLADVPPEKIRAVNDRAMRSGDEGCSIFGIDVSLHSTEIGSKSHNRNNLKHYDIPILPVVENTPDGQKKRSGVYMSGSTLGSNCAYAIIIDAVLEKSYSMVVMSNTSGPIDSTDMVLRYAISYIAHGGDEDNSNLERAKDIAKRLSTQVSLRWRRMTELHDGSNLRIERFAGIYQGRSFRQQLVIFLQSGSWFIKFVYPNTNGATSRPLVISRTNNGDLRIIVPPHLCIDGNNDWLNLILRPIIIGKSITLVHDCPSGKDYYDRIGVEPGIPTTLSRTRHFREFEIREMDIEASTFNTVFGNLVQIMWAKHLQQLYEKPEDCVKRMHDYPVRCYSLKKAYKGDTEAGFILSRYAPNLDCTHIFLLYVYEEYRRKGLASALFQAVRMESPYRVQLGTDASSAAVEFYRHHSPSYSVEQYGTVNFTWNPYGDSD